MYLIVIINDFIWVMVCHKHSILSRVGQTQHYLLVVWHSQTLYLSHRRERVWSNAIHSDLFRFPTLSGENHTI